MKRLIISLVLIALAVSARAQYLDMEPGIYIQNENNYQMIDMQKTHTMEIGGDATCFYRTRVKGETSQNIASGDFLMVVDPSRSWVKKGWFKYRILVKNTTPGQFAVTKLDSKKHNRILQKGLSHGNCWASIDVELKNQEYYYFEWEQVAENAYKIHIDLEPGEYAFISAHTPTEPLDFDYVWDFKVK